MPNFLQVCTLNIACVSNLISILVWYSIGNYATFGGKNKLKFPKLLFADTAKYANFFPEKSGIEFTVFIFWSILWSGLTILCCNFRIVLSACTRFFNFFLLLINCPILLSYIVLTF